MRFENQVIYPHPVLRPDVEDYKDGDFEVTTNIVISHDHSCVEISAEYHLSVPELAQLIRNKSLCAGLLIDCRDTFFRKVFSFDSENKGEFKIDGGQLHGKIDLIPIIYAVALIDSYTSEDFAEEFRGFDFKLVPGDLVAYGELEEFFLEREAFKPVESIITLTTVEGKVGFEWNVALNEDQIKIEVSPELSHYIQFARNAASNRLVLINSLYFSALQTAVDLIKEDSSIDMKWSNVIQQKFLNISDLDINREDSYILVQRLLDFPIEGLAKSVFIEDI